MGKIIHKLTIGIMLFSGYLFHDRKKIISQLLVCNKEPFIKLDKALSELLSLNIKTFALSNVLFATNDHQESFEKKPNQDRWSSIRRRTIKE